MYSVETLQEIIQTELKIRSKHILNKKPVELFEPIDYTLKMGGKRLRPVLLLLSYNLFSEDLKNAVPAALAIEVFHNFTLLHDDIMDKAEVRRNHTTVHKKYSENSAILSGDAMAFLSYQYLLECKSDKLTDVAQLFTKTAIEVCEGQQYDMDFEKRTDVTAAEYLEMIRLKTAVLLACALKSGALLANQSDTISNQLYDFGINLGLAFQLQDDLLDTFGNQETFGKRIGGDILANKKTYLLIKALELASKKQLETLSFWLEKQGFNADEKISEVKKVYNQIGIKELTQKKVDHYFQQSLAILQEINLTDSQKLPLFELSKSMLKRDH